MMVMTSPTKSNARNKANSLTNTYVRASERSSNSSKLEEYGNGRVITEESEQSATDQCRANLYLLKQNLNRKVKKVSPVVKGKDFGPSRQQEFEISKTIGSLRSISESVARTT